MFDRRPPQRREFVKKTLALLIAFVLFVSTTAPAFSQVRVSGPTIGVSKTVKKQSQGTRTRAARKTAKDVDADEIIPDQIVSPAIAMKTTAEIMDEQAARGPYKTAREILRESGVKRKKK